MAGQEWHQRVSCDFSKTAPDQIPTLPPSFPETEPRTLTIVEVDVLGDLVPRAVIEVPHLLLVLHHAGGLALLLILESYVVLDGFKVFSMLENKPMVKAQRLKQGTFCTTQTLPEKGDHCDQSSSSQLLFVHQLQPCFPRTQIFIRITATAAMETEGSNSQSSEYQRGKVRRAGKT